MCKKLLFVSIIIILKTNSCIAQWVNIHVESGLYDIEALTVDSVFAVGSNKILNSTDGGLTWNNLLGLNFEANSVSFPTKDIGYVSGLYKILKTENFGDTWDTIRFSTSWYKTISFINQDTGLVHVIGSYDSIIRTNDGGQSWYPVFCRPSIRDVEFLQDNTVYVLTDSLYKSNNYGNTWSNVIIDTLYNPQFNPIVTLGFLTSVIGIVSLLDGNYLKTIDGGISWEYLGYEVLPYFSWCYYYSVSTTNFYFCGWDLIAGYGNISYSDDGGFTWISQKYGYFNGLSFVNDTIGYGVDIQSGICKTINGGIVGLYNSKHEERNKCLLYPNPANDVLILDGQFLTKSKIKIYNIDGSCITEKELEINGSNWLSISGIADGLYFYYISSNEFVYLSGKFIKIE